MKRLATILILAGLALASGAAEAADSFRFGLGLHGGYSKGRDAAEGVFSGGVQARLRLLGFLGVEALASYRKDDFDAAGQRVLQLEYVPVQVSAQLYLISSGAFQLYLGAGGGYYYIRSTPFLNGVEGTRTTESQVGAHGGAGIDLMITKKTALTGDVRYIYLGVDSLDAANDRYRQDSKADYWTANMGLTFFF